MPLIFIIPVIAVIVVFFVIKKCKLSASAKKYIKLFVCTVTWLSMVFQFVNIARYIDSSGERISNVLGQGGIYFSWIGLILFSVYVAAIYIEAFSKPSE